MVVKETKGEKAFRVVNLVLMLLVMVLCIYPILYIIFASVSDSNQLMGYSGLLFMPKGFTLEAYKLVFQRPDILVGYRNTIFIVVVGTALNILFTAVAAFVMSRQDFMFRKAFTLMVVISMMFTGGMIPKYLVVNNLLNLGDTYWTLLLPGLIIASNLMVMKTYFQSIPRSLEEAARIDGASDIKILFKVILPLSLPVMAVMVLYYGVHHWNSWFDAMLYIRSRELYPLQIVLREIVISNGTSSMMTAVDADMSNSVSETIKYATMVVATVPILCVYPFLQKYFVKGVLVGAVKG